MTSDPGPPQPSDGGDFEALYARLEEVTQELEEGGLSLEQSVALYEEGMGLAQRCQDLLGAVEQRIERLQKAADPDAPDSAGEDS